MSTQFEVPGPKSRPGSVSLASYTQFAIGGFAVISSVIDSISTAQLWGTVRDETSGAKTKDMTAEQLQSMVDLSEVGGYVGVVVGLLFAAAVALLGIFNLKGMNGTRIATWVLAGLGLACSACASVFGALGTMMGGVQASGDAITKALDEAYRQLPAWHNWASVAFATLDVVLYLAVIILLAVPASNEYFNKQQATMDITLPPEAYVDATPKAQQPPEPAESEASEGTSDSPEDPEVPKK